MDSSVRASSAPTSSLDSRQQPLHPNGGSAATTHTRTTSLNERLNTNYVDVGGEEGSVKARVTRTVTGFVGNFITPRHLLIVLRILKAITFCFLVLTLAADLMYVVFLEVLATKEIKTLAGGNRDLVIRVYGFFLAVIAICIELDLSPIVKSFYGFKGFLPRSFLLFFISAITGAHPLHGAEAQQYDDDAVYDDAVALNAESEIPGSAVVFQMVTSFILGLCALTYFMFGLLCFDRFTSKAFLSTNDPLVTTAIPMPSGVAPTDVDNAAFRTPP